MVNIIQNPLKAMFQSPDWEWKLTSAVRIHAIENDRPVETLALLDRAFAVLPTQAAFKDCHSTTIPVLSVLFRLLISEGIRCFGQSGPPLVSSVQLIDTPG
jgi:hypothetical protein